MNKQVVVLLKIYKGDLNPFDECALECALSLENADVTVLAMAPIVFKDTLESLTRLGVKAVLVSDPLYAGSDTIATSKVLAKAIEKLNPDYIFAGRQSIDGDTGQVPSMLSELLGYDLYRKVVSFNKNVFCLRNGEKHTIGNKQLLTFEKFKLLRSPSIFSKKSEAMIWSNKDLGLNQNEIGQNGSPTQVIKSYKNESDRRICSFIKYNELDDVIQQSLSKDKADLKISISKAPLVHYIGNLEPIAKEYGTKIEKIIIDNLSINEVCKRIKSLSPKIVLWEECDKYKPIAAKVAIRMNAGLCADCTSFNYEKNGFIATRPALGGDVIADIAFSSPIAMATIKNLDNKEKNVAIIIGKGAIQYYEKIKIFAQRYNAEIYCSRPIADEGLMDYSKQVGLTGIMINPKVCICIGTSGAVQQIAGIKKSQTIIAINIDKKQKIFDYSDYGIVMDACNI